MNTHLLKLDRIMMVWEKYKIDRRFRVKTVDSKSVCCFRCDLKVPEYQQTLISKSGVVEVLEKIGSPMKGIKCRVTTTTSTLVTLVTVFSLLVIIILVSVPLYILCYRVNLQFIFYPQNTIVYLKSTIK